VSARVAALYVERGGPYFSMPDVEPWDRERNALTYAGPLPVVAHPECGPWSRMRHLYRGSDHVHAPTALNQVRRWGGILEHPQHSLLWHVAGLPRPGSGERDAWGGWSIEVQQCDWGHPARKRTWLYFVGVDSSALRLPASREPTHWASGSRGISSTRRGKPVPPGIKVCSARQRRRTPAAFARWLVELAAGALPRGSRALSSP